MSLLDKYTININEMVKTSSNILIGRNDEIRLILQTLQRLKKRNPILIGSPGVGKSAIIEGLANKINNHDVPVAMKNYVIYELNIALLRAGSKFRGDLEERIIKIIEEIKKNKNAILFIDEMHLIVGDQNETVSIANILKQPLSRNEIMCIGSTTLNEYKKYIESDNALKRRFNEIYVNEPSINETIKIIRGIKHSFENYYGINISDSAIISATYLSNKYLYSRYLPDSAIDIIDECCSMLKLDIETKPLHIVKLENKLLSLKLEKENIKDNVYNIDILDKEIISFENLYNTSLKEWYSKRDKVRELSNLKLLKTSLLDKSKNLQNKGILDEACKILYLELPKTVEQINILEKDNIGISNIVTEENIRILISMKIGFSVDKMYIYDKSKINDMYLYLSNNVIGQDDCIKTFCNNIQVSLAGFKFKNGPLGSYMFVGPTGVGKTELAFKIHEFLFGKNNSDGLLFFNMSEFSEKHSVSSLIGAPPGYVGYGEINSSSLLIDPIIIRPHRVIVFDEIEKAHPDVVYLLLQILEYGELTDRIGRKAKFSETIIIMTSNIGQSYYFNYINTFNKNVISSFVHKEITEYFKPEFLNRIDNIILFSKLNNNNAKDITKLHLDKLLLEIKFKHNINIVYTDKVIDFIVKYGFSDKYGARSIKRLIYDKILYNLVDFILINHNIICNNNTIILNVYNNDIYVSVSLEDDKLHKV